MGWKVIKEKTKDHWLELEDEEGWYAAVVKWDGCIHFNRYFNIPLTLDRERKDKDGEADYIHICNIDDFIERLQALKKKAMEHFGEKWDKQYEEE